MRLGAQQLHEALDYADVVVELLKLVCLLDSHPELAMVAIELDRLPVGEHVKRLAEVGAQLVNPTQCLVEVHREQVKDAWHVPHDVREGVLVERGDLVKEALVTDIDR